MIMHITTMIMTVKDKITIKQLRTVAMQIIPAIIAEKMHVRYNILSSRALTGKFVE